MTSFGEMTLNEFCSELSSQNPTPGGGSASGVALSQAGALACMVANLTIGRDRYSSGWDVAQLALEIGIKAVEMGNILADEDAIGYDAVVTAFRMPKDTEDERKNRKSAIQTASLNAARPPLKIAELSLELLRILPSLASLGNSNAITDVGVSALLSSAACKGGLFNAEVNIVGMKNQVAEEMLNSISSMRKECSRISREVMHIVNDSLSD